MSFIASLCLLSALSTAPQENQWGVHDMERPLPPRIEGATALELPAPKDATVLFDGSHLDLWQHNNGSKAQWDIKDGYFQVKAGSGGIRTRGTFGDQHLHLEWRTPKADEGKTGQGFGNSGVFLMSKYEIQVLETSVNRTYADGMAGSMYGQFPPAVNVGAGPGEWNSYDIFFRAPRFKGKVVDSPAWVTVFHNGHMIHEQHKFEGPTTHKRRAVYTPHADQLPLSLQDHGDPVQFRNIWVRPLPDLLGGLLPLKFPVFTSSGNSNPEDIRKIPQYLLQEHVENLSTIQPRPDGAHPSGMQTASTYIAGHLAWLGYKVHSQTFLVEGKPFRNVIVRMGPDKGPLTVVGAHYDVCDSSPGADDNASGVAALLELARQLSFNPPESPIELVFYALEEPPYFRTEDMGSAHHAKALKAAEIEVRGMISLEMLGYFDDTEGSQSYPVDAMAKLYPSAGNFLALVARPEDKDWLTHVSGVMSSCMHVPLENLLAPRQLPGVDFSDHLNYWDQGFPAMMITDTAHLRNPNYHEMSDTADTLNYGHMADTVGGVLKVLRSLKGK